MAAPLGNKFWLARAKSGRSKIFETPSILWDTACEYFEWVEKNPLKEEKAFHFQGSIKTRGMKKMRPMTIGGLCIFLDIDKRTWDAYTDREDFTPITSKIESIIREQKFAGAAADLFNANIIARDLGLKDKTDITSDGKPVKNEWHIYPVTTNKGK